MYWQVYQHKTVIASENMLVKIVERAQYLYQQKDQAVKISEVLDYFLGEFSGKLSDINLAFYCQLDDTDILFAIKKWQHHSDPVLSLLCQRLMTRKGYKCQLQSNPISKQQWDSAYAQTKAAFAMNDTDLSYLCFKGTASNTLYKEDVETIKILLKSGEVSSISKIQDTIINESLSAPVKKFYICLLKA
jgi:HD superfamily phosphohydrolase